MTIKVVFTIKPLYICYCFIRIFAQESVFSLRKAGAQLILLLPSVPVIHASKRLVNSREVASKTLIATVTSRDMSETLPHFPAVPQSVGILEPQENRRKGLW